MDPELLEVVSLHAFPCNFNDHPVTRRDESNVTAVEVAVVHHELEVDSLLWFVDFAGENHCGSADAVHQQLQGLIQIWYENGSDDQLNLAGLAATKALARQIQDD